MFSSKVKNKEINNSNNIKSLKIFDEIITEMSKKDIAYDKIKFFEFCKTEYIMYFLRKNLNNNRNKNNKLKKKLIRIKIFLNFLFSRIFREDIFLKNQYEIIYYCSSKRFDEHVIPILKQLSKKLKIIVIYKEKIKIKNINKNLSYVSIHSFINYKIILKVINFKSTFISMIRKLNIYKKYNYSLDTWLSSRAIKSIFFYFLSKKISRKIKCKLIILNDCADTLGNMLSSLYQENNSKSLIIQFGALSYNDIEWKIQKHNYLFFFDSYSRDIVSKYKYRNEAIVGGNISFKKNIIEKNSIKINRKLKIIFFLPPPFIKNTQNIESYYNLTEVINMIKEFINIKKNNQRILVNIKKHPVDIYNYNKIFKNDINFLNHESSTNLIKKNDIIFTVPMSTIGYETIYFDKPVFSINLFSKNSNFEEFKYYNNFSHMIKNYDEIDRILNDRNELNKILIKLKKKRKNFFQINFKKEVIYPRYQLEKYIDKIVN